ncbi:MAG: hypothetical protein RL372_548 [Bacteroidota bacterium]|jgi:hypothetical protein
MKKIFLVLVLFASFLMSANTILAQGNAVSVGAKVAKMQAWQKAEWVTFFNVFNSTEAGANAPHVTAMYELDAYLHAAANDKNLKNKAATVVIHALEQLKDLSEKNILVRAYLLERLGYLGTDKAVKKLASYIEVASFTDAATMALATLHTKKSMAALEAALVKASPATKPAIEAAIKHAKSVLPSLQSIAVTPAKVVNPVQRLLDLQDEMETAKSPTKQKAIIIEAGKVNKLGSLMFAAKFLETPLLQSDAALVVAKLALANPSFKGPMVRPVVQRALALLKGEDSAILAKQLAYHIKAMPYDYGFENLFNGTDLTGWKGLVANPIARSKMTAQQLVDAQSKADTKIKSDWVVKDGLLVFTGHGDNLCTQKQYGDFELFVDWKITEKGDAGIYLRGTPQVQIWDTSRREVGAQVGSGGLYNNQKNERNPKVVADNKVGSWNNFHIIMRGAVVTVYLNGVLVTDKIVLENYWDRTLPIFVKEQIELQAHGTYVAYRNIYIRELPSLEPTKLSDQEKQQGFKLLFDGTNLDNWVGNKAGYLLQDGAIVVNPQSTSGGNLYSKEEYSDFEYRFEFQLTPGANNGLGIRAPLEGDAAYVGMELQILDSEADIYKNLQPYQYHGSIYGVVPARRGYLRPIGEWNEEVVVVKGTRVKVILNGETITDADIKEASISGTLDHKEHPGLKRTTGHIGFLGHGDVVRFRNIRVLPL